MVFRGEWRCLLKKIFQTDAFIQFSGAPCTKVYDLRSFSALRAQRRKLIVKGQKYTPQIEYREFFKPKNALENLDYNATYYGV